MKKHFLILFLLMVFCENRTYPPQQGYLRIFMYKKKPSIIENLTLNIKAIHSIYDTFLPIFSFYEPLSLNLANFSQSSSLILFDSLRFGIYSKLRFTVENGYFIRNDTIHELRFGIILETGEKGFQLDGQIPIFIDEPTDVIIGWDLDSSVVESLGTYWFIPEVEVNVSW